MSEITIRTATPDDAEKLLGIYKYYVENTAITYEIEVPTIEDFKGRIEKILKKYPYIVAECDGKIIVMPMQEYSRTERPMTTRLKRQSMLI